MSEHDVTHYITSTVQSTSYCTGQPRADRYIDFHSTSKLARRTHNGMGMPRRRPRFVIARPRSLRRSARAPAEGNLWGNVNRSGPRGSTTKRSGLQRRDPGVPPYHGVDARSSGLSIVGPRMRIKDGRAALRSSRRRFTTEDDPVRDGKQTRSFCYGDDLVAGILKRRIEYERVGHIGNPPDDDRRHRRRSSYDGFEEQIILSGSSGLRPKVRQQTVRKRGRAGMGAESAAPSRSGEEDRVLQRKMQL